jgi:hypothetical protein
LDDIHHHTFALPELRLLQETMDQVADLVEELALLLPELRLRQETAGQMERLEGLLSEIQFQ